jgi:hypothetical protein
MTTEASICSQAAVMCGGRPFTSLDQQETEAVLANELYADRRDWLLGIYRWRFASHLAQLTRLAETPIARGAAAYQVPSDCLHVTTVLVNDEEIVFDRYDDTILCDALESDIVIIDYIRNVAPTHWPPYFTSALTLLLASVFAVPLCEDPTKSQLFENRFQRAFSVGKTLDAQGRTSQKVRLGRFRSFVVRNSAHGSTLRGDL